LLVGALVLGIFVAAAPSPDEDAYIGFVYARSLLEGKGLTYDGVRVEGYTNPLTVLSSALVSWLTGLRVAPAAMLLSALFSILTVVLFQRILLRALRDRFGPIPATALATAASATLALLENSLLSCAVLASVHAASLSRWRQSLFFAALLPLIRFDGVVPALLIAGFHGLTRRPSARRPRSWADWRKELPAIAAIVGLTLAGFLAGMVFRIVYYGDVVPNTAYPKFFSRPLADRIPEGLAYCWNALWASKSTLYLLAIVAVIATGRCRWDAVKRLLALLLLGGILHLAYIGGDVAWKPYYRFAHLLTCLVLLLYFLSLSHLRLVLQSINVGLVLLLTLLLQPGPWAPQVAYRRDLETRYEVRLVPPTSGLAWHGLRPAFRRWYQAIAHDFVEEPFAATGKLLNRIADDPDLLVTSAAGRVVYYSGLRAIDTTGLADRVWSRETTLEQKRALLDGARFLVFHRDDSASYFGAFVFPNSAFVPIAAVSDHRTWVWIFSNRIPAREPDSIGDRRTFTRHAVDLEGRPLSFYTDSFDPADGARELRDEYARWSRAD